MTETATIQDVYRELLEIKTHMVSKEELQQILDTTEILQNPKTMTQVRSSEQDIKSGRTKKVKTVKDLLADMQ
jgi:PHD/YefM family antitoxin component YafN of YafNO toxin-antitoxin module